MRGWCVGVCCVWGEGRVVCVTSQVIAIPRQINDEDVLINVGPGVARSTKSRSHRQCNVLSSQRRSNSASHVGVGLL